MFLFEVAALGAAATWAIGGLISAKPAAHLGAIGFNCVRMWFVVLFLGAYVFATGTWNTVDSSHASLIFLSGFIGIFMGDTLLFLTLNRMGPRRTAILFSMNAPMSALLGWLFLSEELSLQALIGIACVLVGVILAIAFGKRKDQLHKWEAIRGPVVVGVLFGTLAALSQSVGSIIIRPVMESGADPVAISLMRCTIAAFGLLALFYLPGRPFRLANPINKEIVALASLSGMLGMGIGMTLILYALSGGEVGIVSTLSATTPAMMLPVLWWQTKEFPAIGAWIGALLVIVGCALIFMS
ncbi:DMT family transporter [Pseudovibrio brasiliensis]|uniref:DMT family transporter n=1 Tax=Pseudovibrio brasiliensis TaxID=1898042 RepID=A0ABX8AUQ9_9HYPH|nr:DMT family transporter [Pseudovibrio brasiliensis]QUS57580.1 DMT family transporter [Pseudovibrio brasiliensis]